MRRRAALSVGLVLALGACAKDAPRMPSTCTDTDLSGYEHALRAAPRAVVLPGGVPISRCAARVRSDAELQNLGAVVHTVAEDLATQVREGTDPVAAARQLGFLSAAISTGAVKSNGIAAELARRIEVAGAGLADRSPAVARALDEGQAAGAARG